MRRVSRIAVAGAATTALALALSACGGTSTDSTGSSKKAGESKGVALAYDVGGKGDQSFNDAAYTGMKKAMDELKIGGKDVEPSAGEATADKVQRLESLAQAGYNPVIGVGFVYADAVKQAAAKYKNVTFGIIDDETVKADNVADLVFSEQEGSYLAGVAAAKTTKTNTVGFIGGVETPLIKKFQAGYEQGVKDASGGKVNVKSQFLTQPPNYDGFSKPDLGKAAAQGQLDAGADVIYSAAGLAGQGSIEAAATAGKWAIGVDSDQYSQSALAKYKDHILTSVTKSVSEAVYNLAKSVQDGKPETGVVRADLASNGVALATSNPAFTKMTAVQTAVEQAKKDIASGKIKVKTTP
ncbi:BMP family ABC transporter substrate-binding protein [Streptomyces sp. NPDC050738]|uniref:BMP family lipoprotein n=1 Tax=Streptomyces sp. NPDC050738 TaxID=3154744 RepID=UPI00341D7337